MSAIEVTTCCRDTECTQIEHYIESNEIQHKAEIETFTPEADSESTTNNAGHIATLQSFCFSVQSRAHAFVVYAYQQITCCMSHSFASNMNMCTPVDGHWLVEMNNRFAAALWATGSFSLCDCWIHSAPSMFSLAAVVLCTTAMFLLNSIDYNLLTSISANTRLQAIRLFTFCYVIFFSTIASTGFQAVPIEDYIPSSNCLNIEQFYMFSVIVSSSLLRFASQMCRLQSTQSIQSGHISHGTLFMVVVSVCAALSFVVGVCIHFRVYCSSNGITWAALPYVTSVPFLLCVRQSALLHNTQTWKTWNSFLPTFVYCFSLSWPYCLSRNKILTHAEALEASTASFFLILSVRAFTIMTNSTQDEIATSSTSVYMLV